MLVRYRTIAISCLPKFKIKVNAAVSQLSYRKIFLPKFFFSLSLFICPLEINKYKKRKYKAWCKSKVKELIDKMVVARNAA